MNTSLIIGASGQIGGQLADLLKMQGHPFIATRNATSLNVQSETIDIRSRSEVFRLIENTSPSVIYLPAAVTNVDFCEQYPDISYEVNVAGVNNVTDAAHRCHAKLVFFSTDYIFNGIHGPYTEEDPPDPLCEYGKQKLAAEHIIASKLRDYLIIRTTVVFGWERQGKNFIYRLIKALQNNQNIQVPIDQIGTPTYAPYLASATLDLVISGSRGIYNIAGKDLMSRYEFACETARIFDLNSALILSVKTSELQQMARRPLNAGLKTNKYRRLSTAQPLSSSDYLKCMADNYPAMLSG